MDEGDESNDHEAKDDGWRDRFGGIEANEEDESCDEEENGVRVVSSDGSDDGKVLPVHGDFPYGLIWL